MKTTCQSCGATVAITDSMTATQAARVLARLAAAAPPSPARQAASRANGRKGGRPRKHPTTGGGATVPCISLFDVADLCQREGIELRGDDGQPYCCGERMNVRGGIIGPDFAECRKCGKAIGNAASPHINGGCIPSDEWIKENGNKTWCVLHTSNCVKSGAERDGDG